ncbi:MAG TPA: glucose-1-phosphate cytidylyltransferase [Mycobacteriales bacterium]|nr:glucose-1-phosphate cytidylyltransferase [Mycobacteriales bacterium]
MKVVLFCGGYGMRMRDGTTSAPKPMVMVGSRPLLWHVMRYYAHFGHRDFVLCLGYGARYIKDFFLSYEETQSNDFVFSEGGRRIDLLTSDIADWRITFVDTGLSSPIGERLRRVRHLLRDEEMFLANYADVLTDAPLNDMIERLRCLDAGGSMLAVPPQSAFHCLRFDDDARVSEIRAVNTMPLWENGGYFVLRPEIFDHLPEGSDLVADGCGALAARGRLLAYPYHGFWQPADTAKERAALEEAYSHGHRPWMVWEASAGAGQAAAAVRFPAAVDIEAR